MRRNPLYEAGDRVYTMHDPNRKGTVVSTQIGYKIRLDDGHVIEFAAEHLVKNENDGKSED